MAEAMSWKFPVTVAELPDDGKEFDLVPDASVRAALAEHAGVLAVPALEARLRVTRSGDGGAVVEGKLRGAVTQTCVITLDPFDNPIEEEIILRFAPAESIETESDHQIEFDEEDPPEPLVDGTLDLADVVTEFLVLAVDPYPRKPGAVFTPPEESERGEGKESSPFAALEQLKGGRDKKG